jgi:putative endonuclease
VEHVVAIVVTLSRRKTWNTQSDMPSQKRKFGDLGEDITAKYLEGKGFEILDRNYEKDWGEIDIVARKKGLLYFVEVKTRDAKNVEHYLAEYSIDALKKKKLQKMCETYLAEKRCSPDQKWQIDVIAVEIDKFSKRARIRRIKNAVWEEQY